MKTIFEDTEHTARQLHLILLLVLNFFLLGRIIEFNGANTMEIALMYKTAINRNCEYTRLTIVKSYGTLDECARIASLLVLRTSVQ